MGVDKTPHHGGFDEGFEKITKFEGPNSLCFMNFDSELPSITKKKSEHGHKGAKLSANLISLKKMIKSF